MNHADTDRVYQVLFWIFLTTGAYLALGGGFPNLGDEPRFLLAAVVASLGFVDVSATYLSGHKETVKDYKSQVQARESTRRRRMLAAGAVGANAVGIFTHVFLDFISTNPDGHHVLTPHQLSLSAIAAGLFLFTGVLFDSLSVSRFSDIHTDVENEARERTARQSAH